MHLRLLVKLLSKILESFLRRQGSITSTNGVRGEGNCFAKHGGPVDSKSVTIFGVGKKRPVFRVRKASNEDPFMSVQMRQGQTMTNCD